ncbi:MAG: DMT family transporter [Treponema sp.]|nr:DMT family transporter [Treponema sp.]
MNKKALKAALRADMLLLITAGLWGFGFVAQSSGMDYVGPFTFNALRFPLGSLSLVPLVLLLKKKAYLSTPPNTGFLKQLRFTLLAGTVLFIAVMFQQIGMIFTSVGNAGFITGFYVVLTPVFGIVIGKKTGLPTWIGMVFAFIGLYFIFATENFTSINPGDLIILISASFWAVHILMIDYLVQRIDPIVLSAGQFAWCGLFSIIAAFTAEPLVGVWAELIAPDFSMQQWTPLIKILALITEGAFSHPVFGAAVPILYGGLASVGIAYTLQVVAQKNAPPAHATIILCLEGSFAALGGILLRNERPGTYTLLGFGFMLLAMFITQWDVIGKQSTTPP